METLHSVGLMILVFIVIPSLDPVSGLLFTLNVAIVPGVLKIWFPRKKRRKNMQEKEGTRFLTGTLVAVLSFTAAVGQFASIGKIVNTFGPLWS